MEQPITVLLARAREGDTAARDELVVALGDTLRRIARQRLRSERPNHTLGPTALVNEAYLKIFGKQTPAFADRAHFLAFASRIMRAVLVDYARTRNSLKRNGAEPVGNIENLAEAGGSSQMLFQLLDLDRALEGLAKESAEAARAIEMRYFGGMTAEETAEAVGRSVYVVQHDLRFGHAWLRGTLKGQWDAP